MKIRDEIIDAIYNDLYNGASRLGQPRDPNILTICIPFKDGNKISHITSDGDKIPAYGQYQLQFRAVYILGNKIWLRMK